MAQKKTTQQFAEELYEKHKVVLTSEYLGAHNKVTFLCSNGHENISAATNLLQRGYKCKECQVGRKVEAKIKWDNTKIQELKTLRGQGISLEEVAKHFKTTKTAIVNVTSKYGIVGTNQTFNKLQAALGSKTSNALEGVKASDTIEVTCENNHVTTQLVGNIIYQGTGCPKCIKKITSFTDLIEAANNQDRVVLTEEQEYEGVKAKVLVRCSNGHIVEQRADALIEGHGCNQCKHSAQELSLRKTIESLYSGWILYNDRNLLNPQELDILLPDKNLAIEFNGTYWHSEDKRGKNYHKDKTDLAETHDLQLIHISDWLWNNKRELVINKLKTLLNLNQRIYARKLNVRRIPFPKAFLEDNHLQGSGQPTSINYGLFQQEMLVATMTFAKPRWNHQYDYELIRFATLKGYTVVGGASKLLRAFQKDYPQKSLISYANRDWSAGKLYEKLGFTLLGYTEPNYAYYKNDTRVSRYQAQKSKLPQLLKQYIPDLTETDNMTLNHYHKVYDSGSRIYVLVPFINCANNLS
jgi:hypothetical protein